MTTTQNMCPDALRLHLELNSSRLTTSDQKLAEIRANLESRQPQAMEIDSYEQPQNHDVDAFAHKGKGKTKNCFSCGGPHLARDYPGTQKGKGKGCYTCGGNHLARNCDASWNNGKGKGPTHFDGHCYKCGRYGHDGANCRTSKGKGKGKGNEKGKPTWSCEEAENEDEWS